MAVVTDLAAFAAFEALVVLSAARLVRTLPDSWRPEGRAGCLLAVLAAHVSLGSLLATALSFTRANGAPAYLGSAALLLAGVHWGRPGKVVESVGWLAGLGPALPGRRGAAALALATALTTPLLASHAWRPLAEVDSVMTLSSLLEWAGNQATPYKYVWYDAYPAFWELGYLPSLVLTHSDAWLWWRSLQALCLVALAGYVLSRHLGLPRLVAAVGVGGVVMFRHFWRVDLSGPATLKNDALVAAGFLLALLAVSQAAEARTSWRAWVWLGLAWPFLTTKYSGLGVAGLAALLVVALGWPAFRREPRVGVASLASLGAVALATTGHYYVHNLVAHHNPLYPVRLRVAGHEVFAGPLDLGGSSILSNLGRRELYESLMAAAPAGGWAFPALAVMGVGLAWWALWRAPWRPERRGRAACALLLLAGWASYLGAYWSAGSGPGDLRFVHNLNSLRYALGPLAGAELLALYGLWRWSGRATALAVAALSLAARATLLYSDLAGQGLVLACQALALTATVLYARRPRLAQGTAVVAGLALVTIGAPRCVERGRQQWIGSLYPGLWERFGEAPATDVAVLPGGLGWRATSLVAGAHLQHRTTPAFLETLTAQRPAERPVFAVQLVHPVQIGRPEATRQLRDSVGRLLDLGYFPELLDDRTLVATRRPARDQVVLLETANPNGVEQRDGRPFLWVGGDATCFTLLASRKGVGQLRFLASGGPSLPEKREREVGLSQDWGWRSSRTISVWPNVRWNFPLRRGRNRLCVQSLDSPSRAVLSNGDTRPLLLGVLDPAFSLRGQAEGPKPSEPGP